MMVTSNNTIPELDRKGLRNFGLTTGVIIALLFGVFLPWLLDIDYPWWPWALFIVLAIAGLIAPNALRVVYRVWMRFGLIMSHITTPLVLGIVFFVVLLPMAIVMRLIRHDPMARAIEDEAESYRVESVKSAAKSLERPF